MTTLTLSSIAALFENHGTAYYGGEDISQTAHALQCAQLAEQAGLAGLCAAAALRQRASPVGAVLFHAVVDLQALVLFQVGFLHRRHPTS